MTSTKNIIEAIRNGNNEVVLSVLYKNVLPKIKNYVLKNRGTTDDVNEILQQLVEVIYRKVKLEKFTPQGEIEHYMFVIGRNLWIARAKHLKRVIHVEEESYLDQIDPVTPDEYVHDEQNNVAHEIVQKLGEPCATFLKLRIFNELKLDEIVKQMGYNSKDVAKTVGSRCKKKLIELARGDDRIIKILMNS